MRRPGLLIASALLACGAGLALSTPASAAPQSTSGHWCDSDSADHNYYHSHRYGHRHYGGGLVIGINIGVGIGLGH